MSTGDLLNIDPLELKFPFELRKQISCSLQLSNKTDNHVAFKVKTTNPKKYCVRPNTGIVLPRSTCEVIVTMQAQKEAPADMQCKDKFLLQSVKAPDGVTAKDITAEMFNREAGNVVEECKLRVVYVFSHQQTSPSQEGSELVPRGSISDNSEFVMAARTFTDQLDTQDKSPEAKALITKLTDEKNKAIQQNNKLRQELQKWGQSVFHVCRLNRLDWVNYGIYYEEVVNRYRSSQAYMHNFALLSFNGEVNCRKRVKVIWLCTAVGGWPALHCH
ncbi:Vesicle-associated 1-2-like protein [Gossypium australe]|uniref:Vesicle-associated 1-2-like protein n=1 Tax=Gossypium australe TaxID=47621 RepID=A0A5B6UF16_9ROSI|nr:Vesicle-associated 1-2-like protein [Gossypium australe]